MKQTISLLKNTKPTNLLGSIKSKCSQTILKRTTAQILRTNTPFANSLQTRNYASLPKCGQPLFETHPHLLKEGELTPGITAQEYYARRLKVLDDMAPGSMAIFPGNDTQFATGSVFYEFRQDPNFFYLTGFLEPKAALVLYKPVSGNAESIMFVQPNDAHAELWDGQRTGPAGAVNIFNADDAHSIADIGSVLRKLLRNVQILYMDSCSEKDNARFPDFFKNYGRDILTGSLEDILRNYQTAPRKEIRSAIGLVEKQRLFKSPAEIENLRIAAEISSEAYNKAYALRFQTEAQLYHFLEFEFKMRGCHESAYLPVVAGGTNALTIHYTKNDMALKENDMVLVDAAGRYGGYCADISRTWPVSGKFSEPQRDLYQAVLNVQKECVKLCSEASGMSLSDIHRSSESLFFTELKNCGFKSLERNQVSQLYPHYIGHHLGLDVHDITRPPRYTPIKAGQVITIEPGVYVPVDPKWPKHFQGIGIRIEDDVVVKKDSYEVITADTLKEIDDIEEAATQGVI